MPDALTPRTIVITGASDGIGAAAAGQLHAIGERVVIVGRNPEKTRAVAEGIGAPWHVADYAELDAHCNRTPAKPAAAARADDAKHGAAQSKTAAAAAAAAAAAKGGSPAAK